MHTTIMSATRIRDELKRRLENQIAQTRLNVDYYRIRRRLSFPLPLAAYPKPQTPISGIPGYPWTTWLSWQVQERLEVLAHFAHEPAALSRLEPELAAIAGWPDYRDSEHPGLPQSHFLACFLLGLKTPGVSDRTRAEITVAVHRIIKQNVDILDQRYAAFETSQDFLARPDPHVHLFNIGLISTFALARAANFIGHECAERFNRYARVLAGSFLELGTRGYTEGVSYDGYSADFLLDWLSDAAPEATGGLIGHSRWETLAVQSIQQACPGDVVNVASLGDVEPTEMTFHLTALAKLQRLSPRPHVAWLLANANPKALSAQALVTLLSLPETPAIRPDVAATVSNIGPVLRTGWSDDDIAVAVSATGPYAVDHLQADAGTVMIGTRGVWLIDDPGYQQYMKKTERSFTVGAQAHNCPTIDGQAQSIKGNGRVIETGYCKPDVQRTMLDLSPCYDPALGLTRLLRSVCLLQSHATVLVIDRIKTTREAVIGYNWHGHPDAGWNAHDGSICLHLPADLTLWVTLLGAQLDDRQFDRLPGSRGQLTLCHTLSATHSVRVVWAFHFGSKPIMGLEQLADGLDAIGIE
jgi:hypothetical protein